MLSNKNEQDKRILRKNMLNEEIMNHIVLARRCVLKANAETQIAFDNISEIFPNVVLEDIDVDGVVAPNADNLYDAINCYINYGEGKIDEILEVLYNCVNDN